MGAYFEVVSTLTRVENMTSKVTTKSPAVSILLRELKKENRFTGKRDSFRHLEVGEVAEAMDMLDISYDAGQRQFYVPAVVGGTTDGPVFGDGKIESFKAAGIVGSYLLADSLDGNRARGDVGFLPDLNDDPDILSPQLLEEMVAERNTVKGHITAAFKVSDFNQARDLLVSYVSLLQDHFSGTSISESGIAEIEGFVDAQLIPSLNSTITFRGQQVLDDYLADLERVAAHGFPEVTTAFLETMHHIYNRLTPESVRKFVGHGIELLDSYQSLVLSACLPEKGTLSSLQLAVGYFSLQNATGRDWIDRCLADDYSTLYLEKRELGRRYAGLDAGHAEVVVQRDNLQQRVEELNASVLQEIGNLASLRESYDMMREGCDGLSDLLVEAEEKLKGKGMECKSLEERHAYLEAGCDGLGDLLAEAGEKIKGKITDYDALKKYSSNELEKDQRK